ncbi:MAG: extracellular solute-binding protein [Oscillospiraceae bacterium]|nr:extracellular solute-binding protein [Oscillospiraceae bacterium]
MRYNRRSIAPKLVPAVLTALAAFSLALASCKGSDAPAASASPSASPSPAAVLAYAPDAVALPRDIVRITDVCDAGGTLFFLAHASTDGGEIAAPWSLSTAISTADGGAEPAAPIALSGYAAPEPPDGFLGEIRAAALCVSGGELWIAETGFLEGPDGGEVRETSFLRKLASDGAELARLDISDKLTARDNAPAEIDGLEADNAGNFYIFDSGYGVNVLDAGGERLCNIESDISRSPTSLLRRADGSVAAFILGLKTFAFSVAPVNISPPGWGAGLGGTDSAISAYSAGGGYDFCYGDTVSLFGRPADGAEAVKLLDWADAGVASGSVTALAVLSDGRIVCAASVNGRAELSVLSLREKAPPPEKLAIKVATFGPNVIVKNQAAAFNAASDKYKVEVVEYEDGFGLTGASSPNSPQIAAFNTLITSANPPDIFVASRIALDSHFAKGAFEDLYPYLDADSELGGRAAIVPGALRALETGGALYQITTSFSIETAAGMRDVLGERAAWTVDEMLAALAELPEGAELVPGYGAEDVLGSLLSDGFDSFIDWDTGECRFDGDEFIGVLELAGRLPNVTKGNAESLDDILAFGQKIVDARNLIREGMALVQPVSLFNFFSIQTSEADFGGKLTYVGFPTVRERGGAFSFFTPLMMSSRSAHKDAAWEFLRSFLTEEYQTVDEIGMLTFFPTNAAALENLAQLSMQKEMGVDENGEEVEVTRNYNYLYDIYASTPEEIAFVMELIDGIDGRRKSDPAVSGIVSEEAQPYFAGQRTAAEAAKLIQSRVSLYVNERR